MPALDLSAAEARRLYLINMRERLGLRQSDMAHDLGMSTRAYSDLETGKAQCRPIHILAAERLTLKEAAVRAQADILPPSLRADIDGLAQAS